MGKAHAKNPKAFIFFPSKTNEAVWQFLWVFHELFIQIKCKWVRKWKYSQLLFAGSTVGPSFLQVTAWKLMVHINILFLEKWVIFYCGEEHPVCTNSWGIFLSYSYIFNTQHNLNCLLLMHNALKDYIQNHKCASLNNGKPVILAQRYGMLSGVMNGCLLSCSVVFSWCSKPCFARRYGNALRACNRVIEWDWGEQTRKIGLGMI